MRVTVKLFATFRESRFKVKELELTEGSLVSDLLQILGIHPAEVAICLVNGRDAQVHQILREGDVLALFPPVGGG